MIFFKAKRSSVKQERTKKNVRKGTLLLTIAIVVILTTVAFTLYTPVSDRGGDDVLGAAEDVIMWDGMKYKVVTGSAKDNPGAVELMDAQTTGPVVNIPEKIMDSIGKEYFVVRISEAAFEGTAVRSVVIPKTVTTICKYAFYGAQMLETVTVPDSVTYIGEYAFGHTGLKILALPLHLMEKHAIETNGVTDNTMIICYEGVGSMTAAMGHWNMELAVPQSYVVSEIFVTAYHNSSNVIYQGKELSFPRGSYDQYYQIKVTLSGNGDNTGVIGETDNDAGGTECGGASIEDAIYTKKSGGTSTLVLIVLAELVLIGAGLMWKRYQDAERRTVREGGPSYFCFSQVFKTF
jgi:hypothetical protein